MEQLRQIKSIIKTQSEEGYRVNKLNTIDMKWLIEQAETVRKVEAILACGDLNQEEQFNNIHALFYNE